MSQASLESDSMGSSSAHASHTQICPITPFQLQLLHLLHIAFHAWITLTFEDNTQCRPSHLLALPFFSRLKSSKLKEWPVQSGPPASVMSLL